MNVKLVPVEEVFPSPAPPSGQQVLNKRPAPSLRAGIMSGLKAKIGAEQGSSVRLRSRFQVSLSSESFYQAPFLPLILPVLFLFFRNEGRHSPALYPMPLHLVSQHAQVRRHSIFLIELLRGPGQGRTALTPLEISSFPFSLVLFFF